jgi:DNA-binding CsgD family transcriptional regulator
VKRTSTTPNTNAERGRRLYEERSWRAAYDAFSDADHEAPLEAEDLERYGYCAHLVGKDSESAKLLARAYEEFLKAGDVERAARSAFWIAFPLLMRGDSALGSGWLQRARRVLDEASCAECAVHGYLHMPVGIRLAMQGDPEAALNEFAEALRIGERCRERDLVILARHAQGRTLVTAGRIEDGTALFDEIMVDVTANAASPIIVGAMYCSVLTACTDIFDFRRAQAWANVLHDWCEAQPDIVPHRGECLVRHAELVRFHGGWSHAMDLVSQAHAWLDDPPNQPAAGAAFYQEGELHRLRGELAQAEESYRAANQRGRRPQPGLALLRLAQGRIDDAVGSIRGAVAEARNRAQRSAALMAAVEIFLVARDVEGAHEAADELERIAGELPAPFLRAAAAHARAAVRIAEGDPRGAIDSLRDAMTGWQALDAPFEVARARLLMGLAHRELGDRDTASMELDACRAAFEALGATTDLARLAELSVAPPVKRDAALTDRELQVLRLVATGKTNRVIATALGISEKTVARHVSNIFLKLDLSSRAAATAYVYEHGLAEPPSRRT